MPAGTCTASWGLQKKIPVILSGLQYQIFLYPGSHYKASAIPFICLVFEHFVIFVSMASFIEVGQ